MSQSEHQGDGSGTDTRSPVEIRDSIEQTRHDLGDTVEALAAKTDVKAQAKDRVDELKHRAEDKRDELKAKLPGQGPSSGRTAEPGNGGAPRPTGADATAGPSLADRAKEHRTPLTIGGTVLAAFLLGRITGGGS